MAVGKELKELYQLQTRQPQMQTQIITIQKLVLENCVPFNDFISEINNTEIDNVKDIDTVMPIFSLKEYSDNYSKASGILWQYYRANMIYTIPALTAAGAMDAFNATNTTINLFKSKEKTDETVNDATKDVEIMVQLKCLSNFWRALKYL